MEAREPCLSEDIYLTNNFPRYTQKGNVLKCLVSTSELNKIPFDFAARGGNVRMSHEPGTCAA